MIENNPEHPAARTRALMEWTLGVGEEPIVYKNLQPPLTPFLDPKIKIKLKTRTAEGRFIKPKPSDDFIPFPIRERSWSQKVFDESMKAAAQIVEVEQRMQKILKEITESKNRHWKAPEDMSGEDLLLTYYAGHDYFASLFMGASVYDPIKGRTNKSYDVKVDLVPGSRFQTHVHVNMEPQISLRIK